MGDDTEENQIGEALQRNEVLIILPAEKVHAAVVVVKTEYPKKKKREDVIKKVAITM